MTGNLTIAFGVVLFIAAVAAATRQLSPPGMRRNVASVVLVVFGLIATFLFCFELGSFTRRPQAPPKVSTAMLSSARAVHLPVE